MAGINPLLKKKWHNQNFQKETNTKYQCLLFIRGATMRSMVTEQAVEIQI